MHTVYVLLAGFSVLAVLVAAGRIFAGASAMGTMAIAFLPIWFIGAGINMYIGVKKAGYSVADEAPVFSLVFLVPAAVALLVWWKVR